MFIVWAIGHASRWMLDHVDTIIVFVDAIRIVVFRCQSLVARMKSWSRLSRRSYREGQHVLYSALNVTAELSCVGSNTFLTLCAERTKL